MDKYDIQMVLDERAKIERLIKTHNEVLNQLPQSANGMISDEIRNTDFYKYHKKQLDKHFKALQDFNLKFTNKQKREIAKYRREMKKQSI